MTYGRKQCEDANCGKFYKQHFDICPFCKAPDWASSLKPFNPLDWIYDLESYPNIFTASLQHANTGVWARFEVSQWRSDLEQLIDFLHSMKTTGCRMVGFNNVMYDYPLLHFIIKNYHLGLTVGHIYEKSKSIIDTPWESRYSNVIWDNDTHIQQIDLFKIHHFDNKSRRTSLKQLEFNMRSDNISDLPYPPGTILTLDQVPVLKSYNDDDVKETKAFYIESLEMIEFREQLSEKHGKNFLNHNDKKIGTDLFIAELEANAPGSCFNYDTGRKQKRQTIRHSIDIDEIIFPYITFRNAEFNRVKNWLASQTITNFDEEYLNIKGIFKDLIATVDGLEYKFGSGGMHASIDSTIVRADEHYVITDWDVGGYYPEVGTVNNLYPEHLSDQFCVVNSNLKQERKKYKKGTPLNLAIKLARNGAYGDSNNKYSPFYDPQYTLSITINGQLLLCMLAEYLIDIPDLQIIQVNTDGLTVKCPRDQVDRMNEVCKWWQEFTCLELEQVNYKAMYIRDVNNYIGEYEDGKLKRKGAYAHETPLENPNTQEVLWHKNHSSLVVAKAAEAALVHGQCPIDFIRNHPDLYDFMLCAKVGRADQLVIQYPECKTYYGTFRKHPQPIRYGEDTPLQRISRYYISKDPNAVILTKVSPPAKNYVVGTWKRANSLSDEFYNSILVELKTSVAACPDRGMLANMNLDADGLPWDERINTKNKSKYEIRRTSISSGWKVTPCNDIKEFNRNDLNYDYYITEAEKLINPLRG